MEDSRVSVTALITAFVRAYHATHDDPKIFDDFLAPQWFTEQERLFFSKNLAASLSFFDPDLAAKCPDEASALACVMRLQSAPITLSRSQYAEDALTQAADQGVRQYVILGAGLDTFVFRKPEMLRQLDVFEVDHPATQADKRRRLAVVGWEQPAALHWVPVDFAKQDLAVALRDSSFDPHKPTFFSWLGVTYYLTRDQVTETLRTLAGLAPSGSAIVFDYLEADALIAGRAGRDVQRLMEMVRNSGEPMKMGFEPSALPAQLAQLGWKLTEDLSPSAIQNRYFSSRTDGYHAFEQIHLAQAAVA